MIFEEELRRLGEVLVCTDDGSYGRKGFVTDVARDVLAAGGVDIVYAVGPVPMMRAVANLTRPLNVRTIVSLNPVMVDGTGMCGGCRVSVGGETKFACVDGPEFDGHQVDFDLLWDRLGTYRTHEQQALSPPRGTLPRRIEDLDRAASPPDAAARTPSMPSKPSMKERLAIPRQAMPEQDATDRNRNFEEVNLGFTEQIAMLEAQRCIQCKEPKCMAGCPVMVDIPRFIRFVAEGDLAAAAESLLGDNALPAVTGRVCPQETQCEIECIRGVKGAPVAIGHLERFVADWARQQGAVPRRRPRPPSGRKVAVVGAGPGRPHRRRRARPSPAMT